MSESLRNVFILDDDERVRRALTRLLTSAGYEVRAFDSASQFIDAQDSEAPGCLLLDVAMPGVNGLELQRILATSMHPRAIVFLTGRGDISMCAAAMKLGAVDFLTKPIDEVCLIEAVERALQVDVTDRDARALRHLAEDRIGKLTPREREVFKHVIAGRLNKQIASDMGISEKTVKVHRGQVMAKMRVRSVAELVHLAWTIDSRRGRQRQQPHRCEKEIGYRTIARELASSLSPP